jgi:4-hydroxybenzoate polyprenyltransferase
MAILIHAIRLIRLPNLLIVAATQALIFFGLMKPAFERNRILTSLDSKDFIQLCLITLLIAIGGYLINDILDTRTDSINKPGKQVVGKHLSVKWAKYLYIAVLLLGFGMSIGYAMDHGLVHLLFIYPLVVGLLAFYSSSLKRTPILGNALVSAFAAFVVGILILANQQALTDLKESSPLSHTTLTLLLNAFIFFAFVSSLFREIVKDLEDIEGDAQSGLKTTAVTLGPLQTRRLAVAVGAILFGGLIFWSLHSLNRIDTWLQVFGILLSIYQLTILYRFWKARDNKTGLHQVSQSIKLLMGAGLLYLFLYTIVT